MCTVKIKIRSFNRNVLDSFIEKILVTLRKDEKIYVNGPAYLPLNIIKFTVNKSPHTDKKSRDQLEIRTYTRFIIIYGLWYYIIIRFLNFKPPSDLFIEIKIISKISKFFYEKGKN